MNQPPFAAKEEKLMGVIPVNVNQTDPANPNPNPVPCTPNQQTVQWTFSPRSAFAATPITFPATPPPGHDPLPTQAVLQTVGNTVQLNLNDPLTAGRQKYKYNIVMADGRVFDPDIENTGSGQGGDGKKKP